MSLTNADYWKQLGAPKIMDVKMTKDGMIERVCQRPCGTITVDKFKARVVDAPMRRGNRTHRIIELRVEIVHKYKDLEWMQDRPVAAFWDMPIRSPVRLAKTVGGTTYVDSVRRWASYILDEIAANQFPMGHIDEDEFVGMCRTFCVPKYAYLGTLVDKYRAAYEHATAIINDVFPPPMFIVGQERVFRIADVVEALQPIAMTMAVQEVSRQLGGAA